MGDEIGDFWACFLKRNTSTSPSFFEAFHKRADSGGQRDHPGTDAVFTGERHDTAHEKHSDGKVPYE